MINREAIVLAGGLGTRLQGILPDIPKCMAPVHGKPFLVYVLDYLVSQHINKAVLSVSYHKDQIINYFGKNYRSLKIEYAIETALLGTGGAVKYALNQCLLDKVFVLNGDTYFTPDLQAMENEQLKTLADITIAVKHMQETSRYGLVISDESGMITDFREKDPIDGGGWINGGVYLLNRNIFDNHRQQKFSLENDLFKNSITTLSMQAFKTDAFFLDIGIPEDYANAQLVIPEIE